jgi:drug/metabolite transporter (DMT)-like permease
VRYTAGSLPGVATSTYSIWIVAAFGMTALWALVVIVNKRVLEYVDPTAVNFFVRIAAIAGLLLITVPLTVLRLWDNGFGINAAAAGWMALAAVTTWLIAFTAYYYALSGARVAVVAPICSTDPLWTALFAWLILGAAFGALTFAGMAVAMAGVLLITRWMEAGGETAAGALAGAAHGDVLPGPGAPLGSSAAQSSRLRLIALALLAAAGWGLGPVLIDLAASAYGKPTATMMLESQVLGMLMLGAVLLARRRPLTARALSPPERRRAALLLGVGGLLEAVVSVLFFLAIAEIGPVLTMLIMATTPIFTMAFGVAFLRERVGLRLALAAVVTVAGVMLAALDGLS